MGVFLGIVIGSSFSLSFILTVMHIRKAVSKRKSAEEERFRILEKQLSVVAEKCDRTQKACRLLSDIVKENYKTEEKEERETSNTSWSEIDKINALNMGHQINRREIEEMVNSTHSVLYPQTCDELYASSLYPQTCSILSQQECNMVEDLVVRNMALMQNCYISAEEAQRRMENISCFISGVEAT